MEIEDRVNAHDVKLARIEVLLENVATNMDKMANSMVKQELILQKLATLEEQTEDRFSRVHKRIDAVESDIDLKADKHYVARTQKIVDKLEPVLFVVNYPKLALLIVAGLYLFAISDIREPLLSVFGVIN